mmetsp:Transcript_7650/g.19495  ORF Transcript_7650/g.19495 Transcript_7650/m.19495 type:complete len:412 (-) Transcript_7650:1451-2686(-)
MRLSICSLMGGSRSRMFAVSLTCGSLKRCTVTRFLTASKKCGIVMGTGATDGSSGPTPGSPADASTAIGVATVAVAAPPPGGSGIGSVWKTMMSPCCSSASLSVFASTIRVNGTCASNSTSSYTSSSTFSGRPLSARSTGTRLERRSLKRARCVPTKVSDCSSGSKNLTKRKMSSGRSIGYVSETSASMGSTRAPTAPAPTGGAPYVSAYSPGVAKGGAAATPPLGCAGGGCASSTTSRYSRTSACARAYTGTAGWSSLRSMIGVISSGYSCCSGLSGRNVLFCLLTHSQRRCLCTGTLSSLSSIRFRSATDSSFLIRKRGTLSWLTRSKKVSSPICALRSASVATFITVYRCASLRSLRLRILSICSRCSCARRCGTMSLSPTSQLSSGIADSRMYTSMYALDTFGPPPR